MGLGGISRGWEDEIICFWAQADSPHTPPAPCGGDTCEREVVNNGEQDVGHVSATSSVPRVGGNKS